MKIKLVFFLVLFGSLFSCSPKVIPNLSESKTEKPKQELVINEIKLTPELAEGKLLFENNCASCHKLPNPTAYKPGEWQPIMYRMQQEAQLSDVDSDKIYKYVTSL